MQPLQLLDWIHPMHNDFDEDLTAWEAVAVVALYLVSGGTVVLLAVAAWGWFTR